MATAWELITFPFRALKRLVVMLLLPAGLGLLAWWLLDTSSPTFVVIGSLCALWTLVMLRLWWLQLRGRLRSLDRGAVRLSKASRW